MPRGVYERNGKTATKKLEKPVLSIDHFISEVRAEYNGFERNSQKLEFLSDLYKSLEDGRAEMMTELGLDED